MKDPTMPTCAPEALTLSQAVPIACDVAIIGAGPAGLMAAEHLAQSGVSVHVFEAKPSAARKFLMAGKGGLNLTHSEAFEPFVSRYAERSEQLRPWLEAWGAEQLVQWVKGLGFDTFVGSSGRVFPSDMKAAPLLRAWLARLRAQSVVFHMRHRWLGWNDQGQVVVQSGQGLHAVECKALVLATGGGSWAQLGSDGAWLPWLQAKGVDVAPLQPANCGFDVGAQDGSALGWSAVFRERFAGTPIKSVVLSFEGGNGPAFQRQGEFVVTQTGIEGSLVYAASALLRDAIAQKGSARLTLDLMPQWSAERVLAELSKSRGSRSLTSHLKTRLGLDGVKTGLLYEVLGKAGMADTAQLAATIKSLPLSLAAARPMDEAISTAGGVRLEALDANGMCAQLPGVFCAGEMLDWEAPTGGYLLTACMASGVHVARGVRRYLG